MNTRSLKLVALYIVLTAGAVIMVFPIIWTLVSSFKTPAEIMRIPPTFLPQQFTLRNFEQLFRNTSIWALLCKQLDRCHHNHPIGALHELARGLSV